MLREDIVAGLRAQLRREPGARISIDLAAQTLVGPDGVQHRVEINPFHKHCLLNGFDEIGLTLEHGDAILAFEARSKAERPWLW